MKPMSPDERELEELRSGLSGHYRDGSAEEPPAHLDTAILAAARREVARSRFARNWHLPASIAAVLVIGVSLALMTSEIEDPLPPVDTSARIAANDARQAASALAMKQESMARLAPRAGSGRDTRPSRERSTRSEHEADYSRQKSAVGRADPAAGAPSVAAPAAAPALEQFEAAAPSQPAAEQKGAPADSLQEKRAVAALRKEAAPSSAAPIDTPEEWLKRIEDLLRDAKTVQAREQLVAFRKRYPDYRLPETLRELEVSAKPNPQ